MKPLTLLSLLLLSYACAKKTVDKTAQVDDSTVNMSYTNNIINESLLSKIPIILDSSFKVTPESDDSVDNNLNQLSED